MRTEFELFVHEKDVTTLVKYLQTKLSVFRWDRISIGWCGWANAMDCWWLRVKLNAEERREFVKWIKKEGIDIYNEKLIV